MRRMKLWVWSLLLLFATCSLARPASADSVPRAHDGFYLRAGIGPGYALGTNSAGSADGAKADVRALDISTELAAGGTVLPGLVVGGGTFSMIAPAPKYEVSGASSTAGGHHVSGTGAFADYYFDPRQGLHAQLAVLFTAGYLEGKDGKESGLGFGFGAMLGGGYELFVSDQISLGAVLRVTWYRLSVEGHDSHAKSTLSLFSPALLFAMTVH